MKSGEEIYKAYQKLRDFSGSKIDSYAQELTTYRFHAHCKEEAVFYKLLNKAERANK
jgi:hypothetical protein